MGNGIVQLVVVGGRRLRLVGQGLLRGFCILWGEIGEVLRHLILCCDISTLSCLVSCFVYEKYF